MRHPFASRASRAVSAVCAAFLVAGCSLFDNKVTRGAYVEEDMVREITPGVHRKEDVAALLGTPSTTATFGDQRWYYVGKQTTNVAFLTPSVDDQRVLIVEFNGDGVVEKVERRSLADARSVDPVDRETPTAGNELTFFEQLLGNLGRYNESKTQPKPQ